MNSTALSALAIAATAGLLRGQTLVLEVHGDSAGDNFGLTMVSDLDLDGDGVADWVVGAPFNDSAANNAGKVVAYSGATQQALHTWHGASVDGRFGSAIASAGDLDGDGRDDIIISTPSGGYVEVFSGATGLALLTFSGSASTGFGTAVAGGGDLDGDGTPDVLIGEPFKSVGVQWSGRAHAFSGATGALIRTHDGVGLMGNFGESVAFLGDLDGDQRDEYIVGAPARYISGVLPYVTAFGGATGATLWTNSSSIGSDEYGITITTIADLNGDGLRDVLVGARQDTGVGCACQGRGFVRALNVATGAQLYQVNNTYGAYVGYGSSITTVGDLNGNGFEDFAAGAPGTEGCSGSWGLSIPVRDGQHGALILSIPRPAAAKGFGSSLAWVDTNADGLKELLCGARCSDQNGAASGAVYGFTLVGEATNYCTAKVNSQGCTPFIQAQGTPSATSFQPFRIKAFQVLNNQFGVLFYGFEPGTVPFQGGSLCVRAPLTRTTVQNSGGDVLPSNCSGFYAFEFNDYIRSGVDPALAAGAQVYAQYWSRDPASPSGTGLTDGVAFTIGP